MLSRFKNVSLAGFAGILLVVLTSANAHGQDGMWSEGRGTYVGVFGGAGVSSIASISQIGTALFPDAAGGPLNVNAVGPAHQQGFGLVGLHIGREGAALGGEDGGWAMVPALEFEGFYLGGTHKGTLEAPSPRVPEHTFANTFPMDAGVFLVNAVVSFQSPERILTPYLGFGIGTAIVGLSDVDSPQINPPEPGVNHFNSDPNDSCWGFSAQLKAGVRIPVTDSMYIFTEYRYLYVGATNYTFGSTVAPGHAPTTPWSIRFGDMHNHLGVAGIGVSF